ncbi:MAG: penicillin-binding protein 2 [Acidobacteriota bacterium]
MKMDYRERKEFKDYHEEKRLERRILSIKYLTISILILFLLDFWYLQVIRGKHFALKAESNRLKTVQLRPHRGVIKDREGKIIASSKPSFTILINRERGADLGKSLERVASLLRLDLKELGSRLQKMKNFTETEPLIVKKDATFEEVAVISAHLDELSHVSIQEDFKRHYDGRGVAHVVGYVGEISERELRQERETLGAEIGMGDVIGKSGIEKKYDGWLRGEKGFKLVEVDSMGKVIKEVKERKAPREGNPLFLSIKMDLQEALMDALNGEVGAAVFLNPKTGEIYALASNPSYDPNEFAGHLPSARWKELSSDPSHPMMNRAIQATYPPGSTFKVLIAIAALEKGIITENTTFYCPGSTIIYGRKYSCWKEGGHGVVNLHRAIVHSCNVYFYRVGSMLDIDDIAHYASQFGFGKPTRIDLFYEVNGIVPSSLWKKKIYNEEWYKGETISVSIGQGPLKVTPLQMATFISAIANGGYRITPTFNMEMRAANRPEKIRGLSEETLRIVQNALRGVVNEGGTGWRAKIEGIEICGKTGTAQLTAATASKDTQLLPREEKEHAWFIGYVPYEDPVIAFAILIEHGGFGGEAAAPVAKKVLEVFFKAEEYKKPTMTAHAVDAGKNAGTIVTEN